MGTTDYINLRCERLNLNRIIDTGNGSFEKIDEPITKLNILGTDYDYKITTDKEDTTLCGKNGYCDGYAKIIAIESEYNENNQECIKDFDAFKRKVKRHEVIHAYLFESGLEEIANNEQFVDWIAWQFPKLLETFKEIEAI